MPRIYNNLILLLQIRLCKKRTKDWRRMAVIRVLRDLAKNNLHK